MKLGDFQISFIFHINNMTELTLNIAAEHCAILPHSLYFVPALYL